MTGADPLAHLIAEIIAAVPEAAVEYVGQARLHWIIILRAIRSGLYRIKRLAIGFGDGADILRGARTPFELEYGHAGIRKLIKVLNSAQILGRHHISVLHFELVAGFNIGDTILPAAVLETFAPIGRLVVGPKAHVAFSGNRNAECAVGKQFDLHQLALRPADVFLPNRVSNGCDLLKRQFACQYHYVGVLAEIFDGRNI